MPTLQRKQLRRDLGLRRLRETTIGTTALSLGAAANLGVMDQRLAVPDFSGQTLFQRAWLRVAPNGSSGSYADYRVGSFNAPSGALVGLTPLIYAIASGTDFEVHERLSPAEMDAAIDETIGVLRLRREIGIPTIDGLTFYTLDGAASPNAIINVLDVYYYANPSSSVNRDRRNLRATDIVATATGLELRTRALGASMQIVIDALIQMSLAASDTATINYPENKPLEETILWGAAARCYDLMIQRQPGAEQAAIFKERRTEAARSFNVLAARHFPRVDKPLGFAQPFEPPPLRGIGALDDQWGW